MEELHSLAALIAARSAALRSLALPGLHIALHQTKISADVHGTVFSQELYDALQAGAAKVALAVQAFQQLTAIDLGATVLRKDEMMGFKPQTIAAMLQGLPQLQAVTLPGVKAPAVFPPTSGPAGHFVLPALAASAATLTSLDVSYYAFEGDAQAVQHGKCLAELTNLQELRLNETLQAVGELGGAASAAAAAASCKAWHCIANAASGLRGSLQLLMVEGMHVCDAATAELASDALCRLTNLRNLNLAGSDMSEGCAAILADALSGLSELVVLSVSNEPSARVGQGMAWAVPLVPAICTLRKLARLTAQHGAMDATGLQSILRAGPQLPRLLEVDVCHSNFASMDVQHVAESFVSLPQLAILDMLMCALPPEAEQVLREAWKAATRPARTYNGDQLLQRQTADYSERHAEVVRLQGYVRT